MFDAECRCKALITFRLRIRTRNSWRGQIWAVLVVYNVALTCLCMAECEEFPVSWLKRVFHCAPAADLGFGLGSLRRNVQHSADRCDERSSLGDRIMTENSSVGCWWNANGNWFVLRNRRLRDWQETSRSPPEGDGRQCRVRQTPMLVTYAAP